MTRYIPPSQCERCVPVETITTDTAIHWSTELAHETSCPNAPTKEATR